MGKMSWAAYALGVVIVVVLVVMSPEAGPLFKSIVVATTLFVGAIIAALNEIARAIAGRHTHHPSATHTASSVAEVEAPASRA
ncbi:hypothetical protein [Herbiconiux sp. A18JL235]|uniref:Uncharacterized protein n=1 Tax=Herbiconiux sp. A18JL235 TaxID=3152363 RepID=A0AB39BIP7_9MICO